MWRAGLLLVAALTRIAAADDLEDTRDAFGFKTKRPKAAEPPVDCRDGRELGCTGASDPLDDHASPFTLATWLPTSYLLRLPTADANHDAVAHYALGAAPDAVGVSIAGASGLETRWTVEGAPADGLNLGGADTRIPLLFLDGIRVAAGGFSARDRVSTGGSVDAQLRGGTPDHRLELRGWAGYTARSRKLPLAPRTYRVVRGHLDIGPDASVHAVATGPLANLEAGGRMWYAAGAGIELGSIDVTLTSGTVRDVDADGVVDGLPGVVPTSQVAQSSVMPLLWRVPVMARVGWDRGAHHVDATVVGAMSNGVYYDYNATLRSSGVETSSLIGDAIATWRGTWKNTRAKAQLAWHRSSHAQSARDDLAANIPRVSSAYVPTTLPEDPALATACTDDVDSDTYPMVTNCPVPRGWFISGGAGRLDDRTGDRPSFTADIAHRIGANVLRAGATAEDTRYVIRSRDTGGAEIFSLFPGQRSERRFVDPDEVCNADVGTSCPTVEESVLRYRTRYTAAYLEDTWQASPEIAVNGGVRWELMWVGTKLHFSDQFAPRLGASWDPLGGGRSRLWVSMGRSYAQLPAGLGRTIIARHRTVDSISSDFGEGRSVDTGAVTPIGDGIEPITQDELTTGAQVALARTVRATVWMQGRWLRRGLETTATGFDNPGRDGTTQAIRDTGLLAAEIATSPAAKLILRAGYMVGRTRGSWVGPYDPREGPTLYAGSDFDNPSANLVGRLPTDLGHRTYIEGERRGTLAGIPVAMSVRLTAASGRPRNIIANTDMGPIHLIPRGSAGRGPVVTQSNVRLSARWRGLDIMMDVFNAFHRQPATDVNELYADYQGRNVQPISGGDRSDLVWLKAESEDNAVPVVRHAAYGHATAFQLPVSVFLGIGLAL